jgi:hypothetical protein
MTALALAADDLEHPKVESAMRRAIGGSTTGVSRALHTAAGRLRKDRGLVMVAPLDDDLEAAYLPESNVIVVTPELVSGKLDDLREAVLEEALHLCLALLGFKSERDHHDVIWPVLRLARRIW